MNLQWSDDGSKVAFQAISRDNKDRWVLTLNTEGLIYSAQEESEDGKNLAEISDLAASIALDSDHLQLALHNHDAAWINRRLYFDAGWLPDNETYFFLSEQDG